MTAKSCHGYSSSTFLTATTIIDRAATGNVGKKRPSYDFDIGEPLPSPTALPDPAIIAMTDEERAAYRVEQGNRQREREEQEALAQLLAEEEAETTNLWGDAA